MNSTRQMVVKLYMPLCYINIAPNPVLFGQENSGCRNICDIFVAELNRNARLPKFLKLELAYVRFRTHMSASISPLFTLRA